MVLDKKGVWRGYILTGILGLLVVTISLYFIFNEYFTSDDIDWEQCRQSLILRDGMPEQDLAVRVLSTKDTLPLRCGTKVVTIDYKDLERAEKEIADTIVSCWYMVGEGEKRIFPGTIWGIGSLDIPCMACARVHLNKDVRKFYSGENMIDIKNGLNFDLEGYDTSIWEYLNPDSGKKAFTYFNKWAEEFSVDIYQTIVTQKGIIPDDAEVFNFSQYLKPEKGDLSIVYAYPTIKDSFEGEYIMKPYMILIQYDDLDKLSEKWFQYKIGIEISFAKVCSSIETIPS